MENTTYTITEWSWTTYPDHEEILEQARSLREGNVRALLLRDAHAETSLSSEPEGRIGLLCREAGVPVYVTGKIRKMEDIKKLLYVGVAGVVSDEKDPIEAEVFQEAQERFGTERVLSDWPAILDKQVPSWEELHPNADGLLPCMVLDAETGDPLMLAYMNQEAYTRTVSTGRMTYWSRSRQELWVKGETSGNRQFLRTLALDCDADTLLAYVRQFGPACHTGERSCFYRTIFSEGARPYAPQQVLQDVLDVIRDRKEHPREGSYTNYLFREGLDKILKKFGEEATETIIAAKNADPQESIYEMSDLLYHMMVLMTEKGISWDDLAEELGKRE